MGRGKMELERKLNETDAEELKKDLEDLLVEIKRDRKEYKEQTATIIAQINNEPDVPDGILSTLIWEWKEFKRKLGALLGRGKDDEDMEIAQMEKDFDSEINSLIMDFADKDDASEVADVQSRKSKMKNKF
jgi:hypothetical protein